MQIIDSFSQPMKSTVIALGLFDGLHLGHRQVIRQMLEARDGRPGVVCSFYYDDLQQITKPNFARLLTFSRQRSILAELGVDALYQPPFSAIRSMPPEQFFSEILQKKLFASEIFCGEDYRFGAGAAGTVELMEHYCTRAGIRLRVVPEQRINGKIVSSSMIRDLLRAGEMEQANFLLGERYAIDYEVVHGREFGRKMGFPTINQPYEAGDLLPRFGVYATLVTIEDQQYPGITNVGVKPTVGAHHLPAAETHILGYQGDLYGKKPTVSFVSFVRSEQKFASTDQLERQIAADREQVCRILAGVPQPLSKGELSCQ
jgi:riboflavin kinase/FMN adenylyltransferase